MSVPPTMGAVPTGPPATAVPSRFVHDGFAASAPWYDPLTRVFSFGLDARWRRAALERCALLPGQSVLDVATGTGELGIAAHRALGARGIVVGLDFCAAMLEEAQRKLALLNEGPVAWVQARAEALPFRAAAFDCVMLGFALRHVDDLDATLREIGRMLRPGGRFVLVEWTRPRAAIPRSLFLGYMRWIVPPLVRLASRNRRVGELAAYLPRSIANFMPGEALICRLEAAGFEVVETRSCMLGLVSICVGLNTDGRRCRGLAAAQAIGRKERLPDRPSRSPLAHRTYQAAHHADVAFGPSAGVFVPITGGSATCPLSRPWPPWRSPRSRATSTSCSGPMASNEKDPAPRRRLWNGEGRAGKDVRSRAQKPAQTGPLTGHGAA